jgi:hypothetical protein
MQCLPALADKISVVELWELPRPSATQSCLCSAENLATKSGVVLYFLPSLTIVSSFSACFKLKNFVGHISEAQRNQQKDLITPTPHLGLNIAWYSFSMSMSTLAAYT